MTHRPHRAGRTKGPPSLHGDLTARSVADTFLYGMEQTDILQQEPQTEAVPAGCEDMKVNGYVAYLNLNYLDQVFGNAGWEDNPEKQEEFINRLQEGLADVVLKRKGRPAMVLSYSWYDKENRLRRAVELMPVAASAKGLQIVTLDVTGYQELRGKLTALEVENSLIKNQMLQIGEHLKANGLITEQAFRAYFDRQPGGLAEQFEKEHKEYGI